MSLKNHPFEVIKHIQARQDELEDIKNKYVVKRKQSVEAL